MHGLDLYLDCLILGSHVAVHKLQFAWAGIGHWKLILGSQVAVHKLQLIWAGFLTTCPLAPMSQYLSLSLHGLDSVLGSSILGSHVAVHMLPFAWAGFEP